MDAGGSDGGHGKRRRSRPDVDQSRSGQSRNGQSREACGGSRSARAGVAPPAPDIVRWRTMRGHSLRGAPAVRTAPGIRDANPSPPRARIPRVVGFVVERAALRAVEGRIVADASIDFGFSEDIVEAMHNGGRVDRHRGCRGTARAREMVVRGRSWRGSSTTGSRPACSPIDYRIRDIDQGATANFGSFDEMVDASRTTGIPFRSSPRDRTGVRRPALRRAFERGSMSKPCPRPLRPIAYLSPQWRPEQRMVRNVESSDESFWSGFRTGHRADRRPRCAAARLDLPDEHRHPGTSARFGQLYSALLAFKRHRAARPSAS